MNDFIKIYENTLSPDLCNYFIGLFDRQEKLGKTWRGLAGTRNTPTKNIKDCTDLNLGFKWESEQLQKVKDYLSIVQNKFKEYLIYYQKDTNSIYERVINNNDTLFMNYDNIPKEEYSNWIGPVMHKYNPPDEGYHVWHQDWGTQKDNLCSRMLVGMVYLNDVGLGGETEFYNQKVKIKPKQGTLVVWPAYFTHLHRGLPPISNTKYIINTWAIPAY
tara:strand:+ start:281 stop:931 length:651 start_codon:yes stop_codon:yes gene_type:complete